MFIPIPIAENEEWQMADTKVKKSKFDGYPDVTADEDVTRP